MRLQLQDPHKSLWLVVVEKGEKMMVEAVVPDLLFMIQHLLCRDLTHMLQLLELQHQLHRHRLAVVLLVL
jgi:hypothetical protein